MFLPDKEEIKLLIVGLNGSPNKDGNTMFLLNNILEHVGRSGCETQIIHAGDAVLSCKVPFCVACSSPCSGKCFKGSKLEEAFELINRADGIVIGSPVYFGTVSAQLKAFFDKSRGPRSKKVWINKVGAGATIGSSKYGGQETTIRAIHDIMMVHGMIIVGDGAVDYDAGHHGVCAQKPSENDDFAFKRSEVLARKLVETCEATKALRKLY